METRVALVENGVLQEALIERSRRRGIVGNIYKGKVVRVLPGMQAAFVDIGLALVVQVTKDPIGTKGARLTTHLSIPSRYLVYMPDSPHHGVSQRIEDERERERLKALLDKSIEEQTIEVTGGFIVRTAAEGVGDEELASDMYFLLRIWRKVSERKITAAPPNVIYDDLPLFMRTLRDVMRDDIEKVRIDSRENFVKLVEFAEEFMPDAVDRIEYYPGERPIFDLYSVEDEIQKALGRKVQLKSGGYLVIDPTEAMTTIDVNTGGYVGHRNLEETIFKTNLEAKKRLSGTMLKPNVPGSPNLV